MTEIQQSAVNDVWAPGRVVEETEQFVIETSERDIVRMLKDDQSVNHELVIPDWQVEIEALQNTTDETFLWNIRVNGQREGVEWLRMIPQHEGNAVMVGGGSSVGLPSQLDEIAYRKSLGQTIFALNGAAKFLSDRHLQPDWLVICDARMANVHFLEGLPAKRYLISSQCDPSLFDYLIERGADVMGFHPAIDRLSEALPKGSDICMVGGHHTVGLVGMSAATALGFRNLHLYGYDSSDADDGRAHAYKQRLTPAEAKRLQIICAGRKFNCSFAMFKQAEAFPRFANMLAEFGCTITVHGDGLLPTIAREMISAWPENAATCDLSKVPASYDFVTWLVNAEMDRRRRNAPAPLLVAFIEGPMEGFRNGDVQNIAEKRQIMDNVIRPVLRLFGAQEDPNVTHGRQYHYWYRPITEGFKIGEDVPRCVPPADALLDVHHWLVSNSAMHPLVITLRETRYSPERNSDLTAWLKFATRRREEGYSVVFVRDTKLADEPLDGFLICPRAARDLHFRAALYSLARCNLIIANGPAELLQFSDWPFIEMKPINVDPLRPVALGDSWWQRFGGITPPESFPWLGQHQKTVWKRDTLENLETAWAEWLDANGKE